MVRESKGIAGVNAANLIISVGLLALGIVMIIFAFGIPMQKCKPDRAIDQKDCLYASEGVDANNNNAPINEKKAIDEVHTLRLVALITGFILIIPFGLNVVEYVLKMAPGTSGITDALSQIGGAANQKSYSMGHYNMDGAQ